MSKEIPVVAQITKDEKMEIIRSGKRKRSLTGVKENKNIMFVNKGGKYVAVETERKFEEAGVTKKKENFIMFESKLGTEKDIDYTKIAGPPKEANVGPRNEERIIQKSKVIPYLDNYQYKESKVFGKNPRPAVVIHTRLGQIMGGFSEEIYTEKMRTTTGSNSSKNRQTTTKTTTTVTKTMKENKSESDLRGAKKRPSRGAGESTATATKEMVSTVKVGRRGGAGGATSTTTETTSKTKTTRTTRRGVK